MNLRGRKRREFPQPVRKIAFARCCLRCDVEGVVNIPGVPQCETCGKELRPGNTVYEHVDPDGLGGEPTIENCKVNCGSCATDKTVNEDNPRMVKADRVLKTTYGLKPVPRQRIRSAGFTKSAGQRRASTPVEKWRGF